MVKPLSPSAAARCVLQAFAVPKVGVAISEADIDDYFQWRMLPSSDLAMGLRYASQVGWVRAGAFDTYIMLEEGMKALAEPALTPSNPVSAWHAWIHR